MMPETLPSLFFMKETIPGGVLQDTESLGETDTNANGDDTPFIIATNPVLTKIYSEAELPPLTLQKKDSEDLTWLHEIVEHNSLEQNGTAGATAREEITNGREVINDRCDNLGFEEDEPDHWNAHINHTRLKEDMKSEVAEKQVKIDDQIQSNVEVLEPDIEKTGGIFQFCSKHLFLLVYIVLGLVIMILFVLNLVFGFKPILLISLIVTVFILLVLLTD